MSLPVLNTPGQLRRAALASGLASAGSPLIKVTPELEVRRVWIDGTHSADWDMPARHLPLFLRKAFDKLVAWKESEGYLLAPKSNTPPPKDGYDWKAYPGGRFWWAGPYEAIVINGKAIRNTTGEERLQETGGKIAYRVASYFYVREHLAEVLKRDD